MTQLPHSLVVSRCAVWKNVKPTKKFLASGNLCGASAIKMGRGFFLQIGFDSQIGGIVKTPTIADAIIGNFAFALSQSLL